MMVELADEHQLEHAVLLWASTWPRRVTRHQSWCDTPVDARRELRRAEQDAGDSPFVSVYSFPNGHTKHGNVPHVDTLFIDFDFEGGDYDSGSGDIDAWRRDISQLLVRVRRVARFIRDSGRPGWRASLSGHKGVHLFLDFPAISTEAGTLQQFIAGMDSYADHLIDYISEETGLRSLENYVDVTSSDMGRLCRVPNTLHGSATDSFGEPRFCVPVTIEELADITVDDYINYTSSPRDVPWNGRVENEEVATNITQRIQNARPNEGGDGARSRGGSFDESRVQRYREQSNDDITLDDVEFLTSDRPCVWRYYEREDKYDYGAQSHHMELFCIRELIEHNVPIEVIKEFLSNAPQYTERETEHRIKQVIGRDYERFNVETNLARAPEFCGYDDCGLCQRVKYE